jgi:hypothetical protein
MPPQQPPRLARAAALLALLTRAGAARVPSPPPALPLSFYALSDWGGQSQAPFTSPGQLAAAEAMATVCGAPGAVPPHFVISAGNNFFSNGLSGAATRRKQHRVARVTCPCIPRARHHRSALTWARARVCAAVCAQHCPSEPLPDENTGMRVASTFQSVYDDECLLPAPWYVVAGNRDWEGDVKGARAACCACGHARTQHAQAVSTRARVPRPARALTRCVVRRHFCAFVLSCVRAAAELALNGSLATGRRWRMPSTYYTVTQQLPGGVGAAQFIFLDTETLTGGLNTPLNAASAPAPEAAAYAASPGGAPSSGPAGAPPAPLAPLAPEAPEGPSAPEVPPAPLAPAVPPVPSAPAPLPSAARRALHQVSATTSDEQHVFNPPPVNETQWVWLASTLAAATADWIIVVGHHPVWSVGPAGPTWPLVSRLVPMLNAAGVALYISGHEQMMQHFAPPAPAAGVQYLVIGNGAYANGSAGTPNAAACPLGMLRFAYADGTGFAALQLSGTGAVGALDVTLYGAGGTPLYSFSAGSPRRAATSGSRSAVAAVAQLSGKRAPAASTPLPPRGGAAPAPRSRAPGGNAMLAGLALLSLAGGALLWSVVRGRGAFGAPPRPEHAGPDSFTASLPVRGAAGGAGERTPLMGGSTELTGRTVKS